MNALERIDEQEKKLEVLAERLFEVHEILQRILPIVDGIVSVVGRDAVLEAAKKLTDVQRDTHVAQMLNEFEQRAQNGEFVESDSVKENSLLFVTESVDGSEPSLRLLPVESINETFRGSVVGVNKGSYLDFGSEATNVKIKVERIFTPKSE
jgi:enoyl reductase-like protein